MTSSDTEYNCPAPGCVSKVKNIKKHIERMHKDITVSEMQRLIQSVCPAKSRRNKEYKTDGTFSFEPGRDLQFHIEKLTKYFKDHQLPCSDVASEVKKTQREDIKAVE